MALAGDTCKLVARRIAQETRMKCDMAIAASALIGGGRKAACGVVACRSLSKSICVTRAVPARRRRASCQRKACR